MSVRAILAAVDAEMWRVSLWPIAREIASLEARLHESVVASGDRMRIDDLRRTLEVEALNAASVRIVANIVDAVDLTGPGWLAPGDGVGELPRISDTVRRWLSDRRRHGDAIVAVPIVAGHMREDFEKQATNPEGTRPAEIDGGPVPIGGHSHEDITHALRELASADAGRVRLAFPDGSVSGPCRLGVLTDAEPPMEAIDLTVGLMSARHIDLDRECDVYVFRNTILSDGSTMSRTEHAAYEIASEFLNDASVRDHLRIALLSTGFLPAIVGWWRAVLDTLAVQGNRLIVVPRFWRGGNQFEEGRPWWSGQ